MKKVVTFGEIMLRLAPPGFLRFSQADRFDIVFGGSESNVAVSLANYGIPVDFITRIPENSISECALMDLRKRGVGTDKVVFGGDRMGIYFLETGAVSRGSKVVYDRAYSGMATVKKGMIDWGTVLSDVQWFHWSGITPAISRDAAGVCLEAVKKARELNITISADFNYRANLWNYGESPQQIMTELTSYSDVILCNEMDVEKFFDIKAAGMNLSNQRVEDGAETFKEICVQMMDKFPNTKKIVTTRRGSVSASHNSWAGLLYDGKEFLRSAEYQITHIVDRVGAGDSFMGGLIYGLIKFPEDDQKALDFAVAASCLKHTIKGDVNLVTIEEVEKLMGGDSSGRVSR